MQRAEVERQVWAVSVAVCAPPMLSPLDRAFALDPDARESLLVLTGLPAHRRSMGGYTEARRLGRSSQSTRVFEARAHCDCDRATQAHDGQGNVHSRAFTV